jgi:hypothetical protein
LGPPLNKEQCKGQTQVVADATRELAVIRLKAKVLVRQVLSVSGRLTSERRGRAKLVFPKRNAVCLGKCPNSELPAKTGKAVSAWCRGGMSTVN